MKIALAVWKNRVSPVFDSTRVVIIVDIENGIVNDKCYVHIQAHMPHNRAVELVELGVNVLICGAISRVYEDMIKMQGIKVIPFIAGDVNQVIESYLKGKLNNRNFRMPGCGNKCRKRFRGEGR
ncbi:NifB/NifX family molybdenum-iron cluster-binding protein [candidate division KSB1 bacterium]|nr:NifB/NifX family molybdenum-iron cluster-binding protein [candidate division KSB1 bacterium]